MPAGAVVDRRGGDGLTPDVKVPVSALLSGKGDLGVQVVADNNEIADAEDYISGASRGGYAHSIISSDGSSDSSDEGDALDVTHYTAAELQEQIGQQFVDGINPYVEQHSGDEEEFYMYEDSTSSDDGNNEANGGKEGDKDADAELLEWENPSYLVKDLDTGESYRVEEIDQHYTLVTLDSVAAQHESKYVYVGVTVLLAVDSKGDADGAKESTSSYLLSLYTADETADIEIEEDAIPQNDGHDDDGSLRARSSNMSAAYAPSDELPAGPPVKCNFVGCTEMHQRASGYCADHEIIAKEEEDSRAQALYLIPIGARAEFVKIGSHGFVYDTSSRLYTVYAIEMRCVQSGASWVIYRRYQQFKELNDRLRPMGVRVPLLPPKKLLGSFEPEFIAKRQGELSNWLRSLLNYDRVDQSAKNPHLLDEVRNVKRVVLNPRAYLTPFVVFIIFHHMPMFLAYGLIDKPDEGYASCHRLVELFRWLHVSFILHLVLAAMMFVCVVATLIARVYHEHRPESWLILAIFLLYWGNFGWTIYGEASFRVDTSVCGDTNWKQVQDRADSISYFQHFDFVFTAVIICVGACTSYMCGVHSGDDAAEAERRWQKRCMCCFHACTCHKHLEHEGDDDVFETLGRVLGKFFVVRYKTNRYEGLSFTDLRFSLNLVSKVQRKERERETELKAELAEDGVPTVSHFAADEEQTRLTELAFYGKMAIGIYGWPIYVWYSPCFWFRVFGCFMKPDDDHVFDHDNYVQGNRASFVQYTGVKDSDLVYLNCYNFVFQAPYSIVKDATRKELIISVRGSMSFYDFVTDGLAQIVSMDPSELPLDVPNPAETRTHYGMLRTARSIFKDLQQGSRKAVFWDFARANCAVGGPTDDEDEDWKIVVCGHSMGAGVGCILAILLRKLFPTTRAFLYASPPLFDPETAAWTKTFVTTAVYGDDIVPRLSISNMATLRDEMATHFDAVATEPLFKVKYGVHGNLKKLEEERQEPVPVPGPVSIGGRGGEAVPIGYSNNTLSTVMESAGSMVSTDFGSSGSSNVVNRPARELSDATMITLPQEDTTQDVDVPGEIVHIQTVKMARRCGCTMFLGEQKLQYTLRDASYFRRIWVTPRALQDHMVHHYDRKIRFLVSDCMDFETPVAAHRPSSSTASWLEDAADAAHSKTPGTPQAAYREIEAVV
ncbi:hypothetical protein BBJ28_00000586 [Nothophytophthora sp. Chile5]|nr:hypothetical protein BBJ28_00000586 [Nothophytophthora sp. Chile5]